MISQGNWRGYIEGLPAAAIASELHTLCHAALFSKSSAEAVKFLEATQAKLVDAKAIPPELCSLLKKQMERADAVMSEGGWQKNHRKTERRKICSRFSLRACFRQ